MADSPAIIIDVGTGFTKAGITSDEAPRIVIPTVYEKEATSSHDVSESKKLALSDVSKERAVKRSVISNWEEIEKIWRHVIEAKLEKSSENHPLFLTEPAFNPKGHREKMAEIAFEKFNSPSLFLGVQSVLAIYAYGRLYGTVLDVGYGTARAVPVSEGFAQPKSMKSISVAGQDLDSKLVNLLKERGIDLSDNPEMINDIKENHCYVALDPEEQTSENDKKSFTLPDGKVISLESERYLCAEMLFDPSRSGGMHAITHQAIEDYGKKDMYDLIVLSGGTTMIKGFKERFEKELNDLTNNKEKVTVRAAEKRDNLAFVGASILTALPTFKDLWLTKKSYEENGPDIVHSKLK